MRPVVVLVALASTAAAQPVAPSLEDARFVLGVDAPGAFPTPSDPAGGADVDWDALYWVGVGVAVGATAAGIVLIAEGVRGLNDDPTLTDLATLGLTSVLDLAVIGVGVGLAGGGTIDLVLTAFGDEPLFTRWVRYSMDPPYYALD